MFGFYNVDRDWVNLKGSIYLETIIFGPEVTEINRMATRGCPNLKNVIFEFPSKVNKITGDAFRECSELEKLFLPPSINIVEYYCDDLGEGIFAATPSLTELHMGSPVPPTASYFWSGILESCTLYVPKGSFEAYKNAKGWSGFVNIVEELADNGYNFKVESTELRRGRTNIVPISIINEEEVVSFQCDLSLPNGLTIEKNGGKYDIKKTDRAADFTFNSSDVDNKIRILGFSPTNTSLSGNDGTVFTIPIYVSEEVSLGDKLTITISNILVTKKQNFEEIEAPNVISAQTIIKGYTLGDVNDDGKISAADISMTVEYIMGRTPSNSIREAADVNEDGKVSAADISIIVSKILSGSNKASARVVSREMSTDNFVNHVILDMNNHGDLSLRLNNARSYTAAQFDVMLPNGFSIKEIMIADMQTDHIATYNMIDDGVARIILYSPSNASFASDEPLINISLNFVTETTSEWINVDNVLLVAKENATINEYTAEGDSLLCEMSNINDICNDGILSIKAIPSYIVITSDRDSSVAISNILGQSHEYNLHTGENPIVVSNGIYLVDGHKVIVK